MWRWERNKIFIVRSTYSRLIDGGSRLVHYKLIWKNKCPLKVTIFLWLVNKGCHSYIGQLTKNRDGVGLSYCVLCKSNNENIAHLLMNCPNFSLVWNKCASLLRLHIDMAESTSIWHRIRILKKDATWLPL